jgi:hypothetical protein
MTAENKTGDPAESLPDHVCLSGAVLICRRCRRSFTLTKRGNTNGEIRAFSEIHSACEPQCFERPTLTMEDETAKPPPPWRPVPKHINRDEDQTAPAPAAAPAE